MEQMQEPLVQPVLENLPGILNDPALLLAQIRRFVGQCQTLLEQGGHPTLEGLDEQVRILCGHVAKMELKDAETIRPKMDSLIAELDELERALSKERGLVAEQLNELTRQQQAMTAYQRAHGSVPLTPKAE